MLRRFALFITLMSAVALLQAQESDSTVQLTTTTHQLSGNRVVDGQSTFPDVNRLNLDLAPAEAGDALKFILGTTAIADADARFYISNADDTGMQSVSLRDGRLARDATSFADASPVFALQTVDNTVTPIFAGDGAAFSHPIPLDATNTDQIFVAPNGDLMLRTTNDGIINESRLTLAIQQDARIVQSREGLIAVYTRATNQRYVHGIMGDDIEGAAVAIVAIENGELVLQQEIALAGDSVYEGLSPMWIDLNRDGRDDLMTTVSNGAVGAQLRAYLLTDENTAIEVAGQAIGLGGRWQHQLAFAPFALDGTMEFVDVLTPHIGGVTRFYRFDGTALQIVAEVRGYTSHPIFSRNLDMAVAGDFNGDGIPEVVLPSQDRTRIAGIQRTADSAEVIWELPVEGVVASNLATVETANGLSLALVTENNGLRLWLP